MSSFCVCVCVWWFYSVPKFQHKTPSYWMAWVVHGFINTFVTSKVAPKFTLVTNPKPNPKPNYQPFGGTYQKLKLAHFEQDFSLTHTIVGHGQLWYKLNYLKNLLKLFEKKISLIIKNFKNLYCKNLESPWILTIFLSRPLIMWKIFSKVQAILSLAMWIFLWSKSREPRFF